MSAFVSEVCSVMRVGWLVGWVIGWVVDSDGQYWLFSTDMISITGDIPGSAGHTLLSSLSNDLFDV